jgi:hypothetical protein
VIDKFNLVIDAQVRPIDPAENFEIATAAELAAKFPKAGFAEQLSLAAPAPIIEGKPRMLHVSAMIVHEGTNLNGDRFIGEELRTAVQDSRLFAEGYAGIIDIDHDFTPVGYWYKAEFVTDPNTETRGILAHGAIWAYLNPEAADRILAQQHRDGFVRVSMAAISKAEDVDFDMDEETGRWVKTMHNPVFLGATILLDAAAGDKNAKGVAEEDPNATNPNNRRGVVLKAASAKENHNNDLEERAMIEEIRPLLAELLGDQKDEFIDAISNLVQEKIESFNSLMSEKDAALETANAQIADLQTQITDLTTQLEEKGVSIETLQSEKETLNTELEETKASLNEYVAQEEARELEAKKEARLAELSTAARDRLMAKEEDVRNAIIERWVNQSDEEWETTKAELSLADKKKKEVDDPPLPGIGGGSNKSIDDFLQ